MGQKNLSEEFSLKLITVSISYSTWWTRFSSRLLLKTILRTLIEQTVRLKRFSIPAAETRKTKTSFDE